MKSVRNNARVRSAGAHEHAHCIALAQSANLTISCVGDGFVKNIGHIHARAGIYLFIIIKSL